MPFGLHDKAKHTVLSLFQNCSQSLQLGAQFCPITFNRVLLMPCGVGGKNYNHTAFILALVVLPFLTTALTIG